MNQPAAINHVIVNEARPFCFMVPSLIIHNFKDLLILCLSKFSRIFPCMSKSLLTLFAPAYLSVSTIPLVFWTIQIRPGRQEGPGKVKIWHILVILMPPTDNFWNNFKDNGSSKISIALSMSPLFQWSCYIGARALNLLITGFVAKCTLNATLGTIGGP